MKYVIFTICTVILCTVTIVRAMPPQNDIEIWEQFVAALTKGEFSIEKTRPYHEAFQKPLVGFLTLMQEKVSTEEWNAIPEKYRVDDQLHYLIPLTIDGQ